MGSLAVALASLFAGLGTYLYLKYSETPRQDSTSSGVSTPLPKAPEHAISGPGPETLKASQLPEPNRALEIRSQPPGAEVYVDWRLRGTTPITLPAQEANGWLVMTRSGFEPSVRQIQGGSEGRIEVSLSHEQTYPAERLLLTVDEETPARACGPLQGALAAMGLQVLGALEAKEIRREVSRAGGLSNPGLRSWLRSRFNTNRLLVVRCRGATREVGQQLEGQPAMRQAVEGVTSANMNVDLEVISLRDGSREFTLSRTARGFALEGPEALRKAGIRAAEEAAGALKERWVGR